MGRILHWLNPPWKEPPTIIVRKTQGRMPGLSRLLPGSWALFSPPLTLPCGGLTEATACSSPAWNSFWVTKWHVSQEVLETVVRPVLGGGGFTLSASATNFSEPKNPQRAITCFWCVLYSSPSPATSLQPQLPTLPSSRWDKQSENILSPLLIVLVVPTLMSPSRIFGSFTALQVYGIVRDFWLESRDRNIHFELLERDWD